MALKAGQVEEIRSLLEREREKLLRRLRRFAEELGDGFEGGFSQHMAEQAAAQTERENAFLVASEEGRRLVEVDLALDRIGRDPSRLGSCQNCGGEIGYERLLAIPSATLCVGCKRGEEG